MPEQWIETFLSTEQHNVSKTMKIFCGGRWKMGVTDVMQGESIVFILGKLLSVTNNLFQDNN